MTSRGNIVYLNPCFVQTFGYNLADIPHLSAWWPRAYPAAEYRDWVAATWQARIERMHRSEQPFEPMEVNIRCKDGSQRTAIVSDASIGAESRVGVESSGLHLVTLIDVTERKQAEEELQRHQRHLEDLVRERSAELNSVSQHLQTVLDSTTDGIYCIGKDGTCVSVNRAALAALGYATPSEVLGRNNHELFHHSHADGAPYDVAGCPIYRVLHGLAQADCADEVFWRKDGTSFPVEYRARPLVSQDASGECVVTFVDITERKRLADWLRRARDEVEDLYENAPCGYHSVDRDGRLRRINATEARLLGYSKDEMLGRKISEFIDPDDLPLFFEQLVQFLQTGAASVERTFVRKDGSRLQALVNATGIRDDEGAVIASRTTVVDITERKRLEDQLRAREASLRILYEHLPQRIFVKDRNSVYRSCNLLYAGDLGITADEIVGKDDFAFYPRELAEVYRADDRSVMERGTAAQIEEPYQTSGQQYWVRTTKIPLRDERGDIVGVLGLFEDVSERKQLEQDLLAARDAALAANEAKSVFLSSTSHEIRTPLNAILGYSQLLQRDRDLGPKQRAQIQSILRSGDQLIGLIDDILKISRIEAGRLTLDEAALDLHAMIAELATTFTMRAEQKGLRLIVEYMEDVPRFVFGDESKLRTVFNNLMTNAIKFTDLGGVAVRLHAAPQHEGGFFLEVEIEDSGYGISQIDLPRLFRKFEQADLGKRTSGGTGLGLAISREYVRLMGGELSVDSELGRGSVFRFRVRLSHANPAAIPEVTVARSVKCLRPGQQPFKILIADDIEDNREVLSVLLAQVGFEVRAVNDGDAAIRVFEVWRPQLVLMDMRMPVMDGYEATRRIRALAGSDVVIFAVTASARMEDLADARAVGVDDFVGKPFREAHLLATIGRYLGAEYEYWDAPADAAHAAARIDPAADVPRALLALPQGLRSELRAAAILADVDRMLAILLTVAEHDPALAAALGAITEQYDYARVIALLGIAEEQK